MIRYDPGLTILRGYMDKEKYLLYKRIAELSKEIYKLHKIIEQLRRN